MVIIRKNKVLIEFEHPCPKDAIKDLQQAIITSIQNQNLDELSNLKEIKESNETLLALLAYTLK